MIEKNLNFKIAAFLKVGDTYILCLESIVLGYSEKNEIQSLIITVASYYINVQFYVKISLFD